MSNDLTRKMEMLVQVAESASYLDVVNSLIRLAADCVAKAVAADPALEPEATALMLALQDAGEASGRAAVFLRERGRAEFGS